MERKFFAVKATSRICLLRVGRLAGLAKHVVHPKHTEKNGTCEANPALLKGGPAWSSMLMPNRAQGSSPVGAAGPESRVDLIVRGRTRRLPRRSAQRGPTTDVPHVLCPVAATP